MGRKQTPAAAATAVASLLLASGCSHYYMQSLVADAQRILASERKDLQHEAAPHDDTARAAGKEDGRVLLGATQQDSIDDLVKELPGLDPNADITQHAGRIGLSSGKNNNIFYWHFVASKSPESAPLVIW